MRHPLLARVVVPALLALCACRKGSDNSGSVPYPPALAGTQGCWPAVAAPQTKMSVLAGLVTGDLSQLASASDVELLYYTGSDGSIHALDPAGPTDTVLVAAGTIETNYLLPGITANASLSGIAILDAQFLVVAEHASNTLLKVRRDSLNSVDGLVGVKSEAGGFSDGSGAAIRFHFVEPVPLYVVSSGLILVGDTENHALRQVTPIGIPSVETLAGSGAAGAGTGALSSTRFDTPSGIAGSCGGDVLVVESGAAGQAGNRLIDLRIGGRLPFGNFNGSSLVLAGDGTNFTLAGLDTAAQLGNPMGLVSTEDGLLYWVDASSGKLRRYDFSTGVSDCPPSGDCTAGTTFAGSHFSLALGASGALYVLECDTGKLFRIDP